MIVHVIIYNSYYLSSADYYSNRVTKILVIQNKKSTECNQSSDHDLIANEAHISTSTELWWLIGTLNVW